MSKSDQANISIDGKPVVWIDEIPTQPSAQKATVVSIAAMMLVGLGAGMWRLGPRALTAFLERNADIAILFEKNGLSEALYTCFPIFAIVGVACACCGLLSLVRFRATYHLLRVALMAVYPAMLGYMVVVWMSLASILDAELTIDGSDQDRATTIILWWKLCWPAIAVFVYAAWLHAMLRSRAVYAAFTGKLGDPMRGDKLLEDIRTHGRDPRARRSFYASFATHVTVLILIPCIMQIGGCVEDYRVPKGSGNPVVAMVRVAKPEKKKKKKTLKLRTDAAIIWEIPDLDDTEVDRQMDAESQNQYKVSDFAQAGNMGAGGGDKGGWPEGCEDYRIRFIRLEHGGDGWDDGMNETGADINFLREFAKVTPFKKIANGGERHSISSLANYSDDGFPPFVFLTGNHYMGRTTPAERKILKEYCLKGGMLIADAGSREFDRSFREFIKQVFPGKPLTDVADDEMIFQLPYGFPDGTPVFWSHGGRRALGIKHDDRWIVFYHPGDMNDAWKSPDYSDVKPETRDAAFKLGVNLIYYAFTKWNDAVAKARK